MGLIEDLEALSKGEVPERCMVIRTTHNAKSIELYGINKRGFNIPLDRIDFFLEELEKKCSDPKTLYKFYMKGNPSENKSPADPVEIPGFKVPEIKQYLKQARDIGILLRGYQRIF